MVDQQEIAIEKDQRIGFVFAFFAAFSYSTMALMAKLATEVSPSTMLFFRNLICLMIFLPGMIKKRNFKVNNPPLIIFRAFLGFFCLSCFYYAAKHLKLVDSVLLINTAPLFIPIVIMIWDRVKIPKNRIFAIVIGFFGILFILKPSFDFFNFAGIVGLAAGIFMSLSMVTLRKLSKTESTETILFYFFLGTVVLGFFPMLISWKSFQNPMMWVYLLSLGLFGLVFQYLTTKAYTYTTPTRVSVISYLSIVLSGVYGWIFCGNIPDYSSILGVTLVILGGILVILDKNVFRKPAEQSQKESC